jgi:MFS family permease
MFHAITAAVSSVAARAYARGDRLVGGRARWSVIAILAVVLALQSADLGAMAATALRTENYFDITKTQLGLLASVTTGVAAITALPFGALVDRINRARLLTYMVATWAVAMAVTGSAVGYHFLLWTRVLLGVVTGVTYPAVASLIGDYFPVAERARVWGWVLSGELVGTGFGVAIAGEAASLFGSWRAADFVLVVPAILLAWWLHHFEEPARGGPSRMPHGQPVLLSAEAVARGARPQAPEAGGPTAGEEDVDRATLEVHRRHISPREKLVLHENPSRMNLLRAVWYVVRVPTNAVLIVASALGYFFFSGAQFFALQFAQKHYHLSHGAATGVVFVIGVGALLGVVFGGRIADRLLEKGRLNTRIVMPAVTFVAAAVILAPAIYTTSLWLAMILLTVGAFVFAASNPPLDAARLDVMVAQMWGRGEATRNAIRGVLQAIAPVTFGLVADQVFGGKNGEGLMDTFLVMLTPLLMAAVVVTLGRRHYARDVATADASTEAIEATSARAEQPQAAEVPAG